VRLAVVERVALPKLPVKVIVYVPLLAPLGNDTVAFVVAVEPERLTELGETAHVVFAGPPLHVNASVPADPVRGVTVSV
jgi:hypothetical protein